MTAMLDSEAMQQIVEVALDREISELPMDIDLYEEVGMDSIGAVAMIVEIQRRCHVRIETDVVGELRTPQALIEYVNRAIEASCGGDAG
jgi:acyl carrier protein